MEVKFYNENECELKEYIKPYQEVAIYNYSPFIFNQETGKSKPQILPVPIVAKYILNKKLVGEFLFKDYAEKTESAFEIRKGMLRIYDKNLGIYRVADAFLRQAIGEFLFSDLETLEFLKCCSFAKNKSNEDIVYRILMPSLKEEINRKLKECNNHWNVSFQKGFLSISFKNGTLVLNTKENKIEFYNFHSPQLLATIYFPVEFTKSIFDRKDNRLIKFLDFKLGLNNQSKKDFFKALIFDYLNTENKSHHIICVSGDKGSGKSTLKEHLMNFRSKENWCSEINLSSLVGTKFSVPDWFYSQCIFANETTKKFFEDNVTFKQLIAKETIAVEQKGIDTIFLKAFSKIFAIGEEPIRIAYDGGVSERILNFRWSNDIFNFSEKEREDYKEYYKEIKEEDETGKDALLQYLSFKKYEDFTDLLIKGFMCFCRDNYADNRRSFRKKYEEFFIIEMQIFARMQMPYIENYEEFFEENKYSFIKTSKLVEIVNHFGIDGITKNETLKQRLKLMQDNAGLFSDYKEHYSSSQVTVKLANGKKYTLNKKNQYTFGISLREIEEIKIFLLNNKNKSRELNHIAEYKANIDEFFEISKEDYQKIFPEVIELAEVVDEKKIEQVEQQALEFSEAGEEAVTLHGHKTIDEIAKEIDEYFDPNKVE